MKWNGRDTEGNLIANCRMNSGLNLALAQVLTLIRTPLPTRLLPLKPETRSPPELLQSGFLLIMLISSGYRFFSSQKQRLIYSILLTQREYGGQG